MKIYISGKITGIEEKAFVQFENKEAELKARGHDVVNPMKLPHDHDKHWHSYMREDIKALCDCNTIYMMKGWEDSKGAIMEHEIAVSMGLKVIYE